MVRGTRARGPRGQRFGYGDQRRASFLEDQGRGDRHWGIWSGMEPFPSLVETGRIEESNNQRRQQPEIENTHVLGSDGLDDICRRCTK
jgi:hypothetical protein